MGITLNGITLPSHLLWLDEFDWLPIAHSSERSLTGKMLIEEASLIKGRPITLESDWATRAVIEQLYALASQPNQTHTLDIDGRVFTVMFRHGEQPISAVPIKPLADPGPNDYYLLTLRLIEV
ncbi:hypothetical protein [Marinobacterium sp. MBR-109]|jgi:hypothetical protein|uniref:hypothetical protein n=1 Tax=Marinobacterium sp. MBR-109 TaxID=3156462 RepID=UPI003392CEEC